jgi:acyl-coenzyme A synthetase/AMP-(fatty) acid ligase
VPQTGATAFPLSARNSAVAVAHLLRSTNAHHVFISEDLAMQTLYREAAEHLAKDGFTTQAHDVPHFEDVYNDEPAPASEDVRIATFDFDALVVILHSSGTSAFPKPIRISNRRYVGFGTALCE